ncbi:hypothetical protein CONPUDRAFT_70749 [Coniophora puteana RWD-64-598 SS2]|uniref:Uncharacterized protein n=1 Tax=Coniophora puteana (strain RWD-64-598) TaxID=741705 RepID=A0A5M3MXR5_CONPW|nr:uncharacterized protein CONPUDRAFT_70749 [Coniophora puteana RWD-64-598 SS2]EIW83807.1 hypothetical protein CONPUDRAFT_70749 [Coniophora puteana RWD-64-598 SS2]
MHSSPPCGSRNSHSDQTLITRYPSTPGSISWINHQLEDKAQPESPPHYTYIYRKHTRSGHFEQHFMLSLTSNHNTASTILSASLQAFYTFQSFNRIVSIKTTQGWPDPQTLGNIKDAHWSTIDSVVPDLLASNVGSLSIPQLAVNTPGLSNSTIYDVAIQPNEGVGNATVNSTTISFNCGLFHYKDFAQDYPLPPAPLVDTVLLQIGPTQTSKTVDALYMLSTDLDITDDSLINEYRVGLNWTYSNGSLFQNQVIWVYFVECAMTTESSSATIDVTTNALVSPPSVSSPAAKAWGPFPSPDTNTSPAWLTAALLNSEPTGEYVVNVSYTYASGVSTPNQWYDVTHLDSFSKPDKVRLASLLKRDKPNALRMLYSGDSILLTLLEQLIFVTIASFVMIVAEIKITGFRTQRDTRLGGTGILDVLWLSARLPALTRCMEHVMEPTIHSLRTAGMHEVCVEEELPSGAGSTSR